MLYTLEWRVCDGMKKKYKFSLTVVGIFIVSLLILGVGHGVHSALSDKYKKDSTTLACFKVYYSKESIIEMTNIKAVLDADSVDL